MFTVESTIFNDSYPWLGIRVNAHPEIVPTLVTASGTETQLLRVKDPRDGSLWCISCDEWDSSKQQHFSELRRSAGTYRFQIGNEGLVVQNYISGSGESDVQAYVDDFRGNLLWMIMNDDAGAIAAGSGVANGAQLATILEAFHTASRKVLSAPLVAVNERRRSSPVSKVRATAETFREIAQNPSARRLTGRIFDESANTAENRYLRHILGLVIDWTRAWFMASSRQATFLDELAVRESERAQYSKNLTRRAVDPDVFDSQTADITRRIEALTSYRNGTNDLKPRQKSFPISLGKRFRDDHAFFYDRLSDAGPTDQNVDFRIVVFPEDVFNIIQSAMHFCSELVIKGTAISCVKSTKNGKNYRELTFATVSSISPRVDVIAQRAAKRLQLRNAEWMVPLSSAEKQETRREARSAELRAKRALDKREAMSSSIDSLRSTVAKLASVDDAFRQMGVACADAFPTGMTFVANPAYAASLASFKMAADLFKRMGFDPTLLDGLEKVGILHASDIYEKWCLLKIFALLIEDFRFTPENGWAERLVGVSIAGERNVVFGFRRDDIGVEVLVAYQFETREGRRPDFVVRILDARARSESCLGGLVLDAKFRSTWGIQGPRHVLDELVRIKGYGDVAGLEKVFILQPRNGTVTPSMSPLEWGRHCDYGATKSHAEGWIQVGFDSSGITSTDHLKRLLVMVFQSTLPDPERVPGGTLAARSFCLGCGEAHHSESIRSKATKGGATSWLLDCAQCGVWTVRTHCYSCKAPLFKNGTRWTYHETLAAQVTNVVCPQCGSYFNSSFDRDD
ncbi:hypothetical protein [Pseudoxanthomonas mexicana]|uniref:hypothetical protein n=1 Tax=Pseudoxanthomonas mexicana TaxID=128785 RepID=UPI00398B9BB3